MATVAELNNTGIKMRSSYPATSKHASSHGNEGVTNSEQVWQALNREHIRVKKTYRDSKLRE